LPEMRFPAMVAKAAMARGDEASHRLENSEDPPVDPSAIRIVAGHTPDPPAGIRLVLRRFRWNAFEPLSAL